MRRFIETSVPTDKYQEVKTVGNRYVVHLEPRENEDGTTTCYECMTGHYPDMVLLRTELAAWKEYIGTYMLNKAKERKKQAILAYDSSSAVNAFTITKQGMPVTDYWLDSMKRATLGVAVRAAQALDKTTYDFDVRELSISLTLDCGKFLSALNRLENYACAAYNITSRHIAAVNALETVEEVEAYDFQKFYPEKLTFEVTEMM